jgi:activating signal cointegrator 1
MKALTLTQPWATLVAIGAKKIETRSWNTTYRGPLAIHAAAGKYVDDYLLMKIEPFYSALRAAGIESRLQIRLGGIVATCELVDVKRIDEVISFPACKSYTNVDSKHTYVLTTQERAFGDYSVGRYMWLLENIVQLPEPIAAKGALSLWEWEPAQ